jgi:hypothetical protein
MEKGRFVEVAPLYYALAICAYFLDRSGSAYAHEIESYFTQPETPEDPEVHYLERPLLFAHGMRWLADRGMVEQLFDDFGPTIYRRTDSFASTWEELIGTRDLPFYNFNVVHDALGWLHTALSRVNTTFHRLDITEEDFENPDSDWQPIPLERDDLKLKAATDAIDATIAEVRSNNGYNATLPEERDFVLAGLEAVSNTLKTATSTSLPYLRKYAIEPLMLLVRRFKDAAIGVLATTARETIIDFLKEHGARFLESLFR